MQRSIEKFRLYGVDYSNIFWYGSEQVDLNSHFHLVNVLIHSIGYDLAEVFRKVTLGRRSATPAGLRGDVTSKVNTSSIQSWLWPFGC